MMRGAPRPEPVGAAEKVTLVDRVQHPDHRPLDDLVLQRGDPERPEPAVGLRDVAPARRSRSVRAPVDPSMQIPKLLSEVLPVFPPRHPVNAWRGTGTNRPI